MRIAAIDIGTNSIHLHVADIDADGNARVIESAREQAELGAGGLDAEVLADDAFERGVQALIRFREACDSFNVEHISCAATSAVREASNGAAFCAAVKEHTGIHVSVIAGVEEARLIWMGARQDLDFSRGRNLLFDVGGGSTELILGDAESILASESLRLGHIRLAEGFHHSDPMTPAELQAMREAIQARMQGFLTRVYPDDIATIVGTSGTVRALARMHAMRQGLDVPEHQHGMILTLEGVDALVEELCGATEAQRRQMSGLDTRRVRTLPAGAVLVQEVLRAFDKPELITSNRSLRDGLIAKWVHRHRPELALARQVPDPRQRSVRAMMERYGVKPRHAGFVRSVALRLFDATVPFHHLRIDDRRLLGFASQLHDVGHHISGQRHDKRGAYLIRHTHLPGFTAPEISVMERVVRYHRAKAPTASHPRFARLGMDDQHRIRVLSALLAFADAFDRGHHGNVVDFAAKRKDGRLVIRARTQREPDLERWASLRRADRVREALGIEVDIDIQRARADEPAQAPVDSPA